MDCLQVWLLFSTSSFAQALCRVLLLEAEPISSLFRSGLAPWSFDHRMWQKWECFHSEPYILFLATAPRASLGSILQDEGAQKNRGIPADPWLTTQTGEGQLRQRALCKAQSTLLTHKTLTKYMALVLDYRFWKVRYTAIANWYIFSFSLLPTPHPSCRLIVMQKVLVRVSGEVGASPDSEIFSCMTLNMSRNFLIISFLVWVFTPKEFLARASVWRKLTEQLEFSTHQYECL